MPHAILDGGLRDAVGRVVKLEGAAAVRGSVVRRAVREQAEARIKAALERTRIRPEAYFERLVGEPRYKFRAGEYRIIAEITQGKLLILVVEVGHRKNIYKKG